MKNHFLSVFTALIILSVGSSSLSAQSLKPVETPVVRFLIMLDPDMSNLMELDSKTTYALAMQLKNEKATQIYKESFQMVQQMINDSTILTIPDADRLEGIVQYSLMGFPINSIKKAAKKGNSEQYVDISIHIENPTGSVVSSTKGENEGITTGTERIRIRPQVRVEIKIGDSEGKKIARYVGKYKHDEKFEINNATIGIAGFQLATNIAVEPIPYHFILAKAIEDLVKQLPK